MQADISYTTTAHLLFFPHCLLIAAKEHISLQFSRESWRSRSASFFAAGPGSSWRPASARGDRPSRLSPGLSRLQEKAAAFQHLRNFF